MTKNVTDIMRRERRRAMERAFEHDRNAARLEEEAVQCRAEAERLRQLHCQLGASIQVLDGDNAPLDLPEEQPFPYALAASLTPTR